MLDITVTSIARSPSPQPVRKTGFLGEDPSWLFNQVNLGAHLLIIDCRPLNEFSESHVKGAINIFVPTLKLRRLRKANVPLSTVLSSEVFKEKFERRTQVERIIIYDEDSITQNEGCKANEFLCFLLTKLSEDNRVCFLEGGFRQFEKRYPHLCSSGDGNDRFGKLSSGLSGLRISDPNNNSNTTNSYNGLNLSHGGTSQLIIGNTRKEALYRPDSAGPTEIINHLYLGNKIHSCDIKQLTSLNITHILNVTHDLPNEFEHIERYRYLKLPIQDNWDGNIIECFPKAFDFIDEARKQCQGVLVHCLGGISRSSTIIIAYLMYKYGYSLNDAYDFVKLKKSNIAPNFNFMGQLLDLEQRRSSPPTPSHSNESTPDTSPNSSVSDDRNGSCLTDQSCSPSSSSSCTSC